MSFDYSSPAAPYLIRISRILIVFIFLIGVMALVGWTTHQETLKRLIPEAVAVNPLSAICFLLCSISLWMQKDIELDANKIKIAKRFALVVAFIEHQGHTFASRPVTAEDPSTDVQTAVWAFEVIGTGHQKDDIGVSDDQLLRV